MSKNCNEDVQNYWMDVFEQQKVSGKSIKRFCLDLGIPPTSFHSARRRYLKQTPACSAEAIMPVVIQNPVGKVTVSINGITLSYDSGTSAEDLQSVISCLVKL